MTANHPSMPAERIRELAERLRGNLSAGQRAEVVYEIELECRKLPHPSPATVLTDWMQMVESRLEALENAAD